MLATATPDRLLPSTACDLQALLGADNAAAFDISAACPGFVFATTIAEGLIASGQSENVLVIGAEKLSTITDFQDRSTAILFGDGAGAAVIRRTTGQQRPRNPFHLPQVGREAGAAALPARRRCRGSDQREGGLRAVALHEDGRAGGVQGGGARHVRGLRRGPAAGRGQLRTRSIS